MDGLPKRKKLRLDDYDYSQPGIYFITVCTHNRIEYFGRVIPTQDQFTTATVELTDSGKIVEQELLFLKNYHPSVAIDAYVIMPNHVHFLLNIKDAGAPSLSRIIRLWKSSITKKISQSLWQKSFHDHVVRNDEDYMRLLTYIENNPAQWELDSLNPQNS